MHLRASIVVFVIVLSLAPRASRALGGTLHSAAAMGEGGLAVGADVGFPYLTVEAAYGLSQSLDLATRLRTGWGRMQRAGVGVRWGLRNESTATALRIDVDALLQTAPERPWDVFTGLYDASLSGSFLHSWYTSEGTVLTLEATLEAVGYNMAPLEPLGGTRPFLTFGPNVAFRLGVEWPLPKGVWLAMDLGMRLHMTGFQSNAALPMFSVGLAHVLF